MKLRTALFKNGLASSWVKFSSIALRIVQVPLLLAYLDVEEYGAWLLVSSLPAWISLANMGFGSVASNQLSLLVAARKLRDAQVVFSTTMALISLVGVCGLLVLIPTAFSIPWHSLLSISATRHREVALSVAFLGMAVLLSFYGEVFAGRFRAARQAHRAMLIGSVRPWFELSALALTLQFTHRFDYLGLATLLATSGSLAVAAYTSWRSMPTLRFSASCLELSQARLLLRKAIAFQMIPLGHAIVVQGFLVVIQLVLGAAAVAVFATVRTLIHSIHQIVETINQITWSELSHLMGSGDTERAARLHRISVAVALALSCLLSVALGLFGDEILLVWTKGKIGVSGWLLFWFVVPIPIHAIWYASCVIILASNRHEGFAWRYTLSALLSLVLCALLASVYGIEGAAIATLLLDLVMLHFVLRTSLQITRDTPQEFFTGAIFELRLHSRAVLRKLCRAAAA